MYNLFHKKPPKQKVAFQQDHASLAYEYFISVILGGIFISWLLTAATQPSPRVGDLLNCDGNMPPPSAGYTIINATMAPNIWTMSGQTCRMNLKTMVLAKGTTEIAAINAKQVILQWHAAKGTPAIGCPPAPAFLAVNSNDYQHMLSWEATAIRPYFRG